MTITYDEPLHYDYGWRLLQLDASRGLDNSKMPYSMLNALPRRLAPLIAPAGLQDGLESIAVGRYATVACALLLGVLIFRWARALYGPAGGLLALALFAFDPNILAHGALVTTDLYAAWMTALAVWSFWRLLNHEGPGWWRVAIGGAVLFGLAQVAKYTSAYLVPIFLLTALGHAALDLWALVRARRLRTVAGRLATAGTVATLYAAAFLIVANAAYWGQDTLKPFRDYELKSRHFEAVRTALGPLAGVRVPVPEPYLQGLDRVLGDEREGGNVYLLGKVGRDGVPGARFPGYYAVVWLYKVPIATQVLLLLALVAYVLRFRSFNFRRNEWPLAAAILFFAWYFLFVFKIQKGIRFALVVLPLLFVFAGSLLRDAATMGRASRMAIAGLVLYLMASTVSYAPHFIPYFNEFVRDRTQSYRILVDSNLDWGQNLRYLERYVRRHPEAYVEPEQPRPGTLVVSANKFSGLLLGEQFRWLRENFEPVGNVAYALLLFEITPESLRRVTDPVPPDYGDKVN